MLLKKKNGVTVLERPSKFCSNLCMSSRPSVPRALSRNIWLDDVTAAPSMGEKGVPPGHESPRNKRVPLVVDGAARRQI